jgi:hypothetical protein
LAWFQIEVKLFCISHIIDGRVEIWPLYRELYNVKMATVDWYIKIEIEYKNTYAIRVSIPLNKAITKVRNK